MGRDGEGWTQRPLRPFRTDHHPFALMMELRCPPDNAMEAPSLSKGIPSPSKGRKGEGFDGAQPERRLVRDPPSRPSRLRVNQSESKPIRRQRLPPDWGRRKIWLGRQDSNLRKPVPYHLATPQQALRPSRRRIDERQSARVGQVRRAI